MIETFRLPMPPSLNSAYANRKGAGRGRIATKALRNWKADAGIHLMLALTGVSRRPVFGGRVDVLIQVPVPSNGRRRDADNSAKPVLDLLVAHGVLVDDSWAYVEGCAVRWVDGAAEDGNCTVVVRQTATEPATRATASRDASAVVGKGTAVTRQRRASETPPTPGAEMRAEAAISPRTAAKRPSLVSMQRGTVPPAQQAHGKRPKHAPKAAVMKGLAAMGVSVDPSRVHVQGGRRP